MNDKFRPALTAGAAAFLVLIAASLAGCNLAAVSPAPSVSIFSGAAPVVYSLSAGNNVVAASVNRNKEGVVLGSTLDEYMMPTSWAKVPHPADNALYNVTVAPAGADVASFMQFAGDSAYYAKYVQVGTGTTDVRIFTVDTSGSSVIYTHADSDATKAMSLPSASLSAANQAWYGTQMAAGNYTVLDGSQAVFAGLDYVTLAGSPAFAGATKTNRWLTANNDAAWKSGRDAALAFCQGKILVGAATMSVAQNAGKWILGIDNTQVDTTWSFASYFPILLSAYASTGSAVVVDTVSGATQ